ncbi:unnamed protein product, partial [Didymodactylos carnosus]
LTADHTNERQNMDEIQRRNDELINEMSTLKNDNDRYHDQIQHYETTIEAKDDLLKLSENDKQQLQLKYADLENKHAEQHNLVVNLSTHLAAKESETMKSSTTAVDENQTWNAVLEANNYLRTENTHLLEQIESVQLDNAKLNEKCSQFETKLVENSQIIDELNAKNMSLQSLQNRFDNDQAKINNLKQMCLSFEQKITVKDQENERLTKLIDELNQRIQSLTNQLCDTEEKSKIVEENIKVKQTDIDKQIKEIETLNGRIKKAELDNQQAQTTISKLQKIARKYRQQAVQTGGSKTENVIDSSVVNEGDELLGTSTSEGGIVGQVDQQSTIVTPALTTQSKLSVTPTSIPTDVIERMAKLRDAIVHARSVISTQHVRIMQLTTELAQSRQSHISSDLTEVHQLVDNIRQTYETEIQDLKYTLQLFENIDASEQMNEIIKLRKKIEELTNNNKATSSTSTILPTKQSEDVVPKQKPQAIASPITQKCHFIYRDPSVSRIAPIIAQQLRQIGVIQPITATSVQSQSPSQQMTTSIPPVALQISSTIIDTSTNVPSTTIISIPITTSAATVNSSITNIIPSISSSSNGSSNLFMKRIRPDDDMRSGETTLKRTKPENEASPPPPVAHVEPQVRVTTSSTIIQESTLAIEIDDGGQDIVEMDQSTMFTDDDLGNRSDMGVNILTETPVTSNLSEQSIEPVAQSHTIQVAVDDQPEVRQETNEGGDQTERREIAPIVYDVQAIPTIGTVQPNMASRGRQIRPQPTMPLRRAPWSFRGAPRGRGGPPPRQ